MFKVIQTSTTDCIVACATGGGTSAIAIIRLSGEKSFEILEKIFSKKISHQKSHTLHFGNIVFNEAVVDEVVVGIYKNPQSYTSENIVEISCHGSPFIVEQIIQACIHNGARLAKAGEFTQRAFLNKKLSLVQAEAVADLIHAENDSMHKNAMQNLRGGFVKNIVSIKERLIKFAALSTLELDFAEEDVAFANRNDFIQQLHIIKNELALLIESFRWGNAIKNGISIAIVGKPNAGKSTLLNTVLNEERAIVSNLPGTTRDAIEEKIIFKDLCFRFIDTAGIRHSTDEIEKIGVKKTFEKIKSANLIIFLIDANEFNEAEILLQCEEWKNQDKNFIVVFNKSDLVEIQKFKALKISNYLLISAQNQEGIKQFLERIYQLFSKETPKENIFITNIRHYELLQKINDNILLLIEGINDSLSSDLLNIEIQHCLFYIGQLNGDVNNEHVLDYVFSKFCIGK